MMKNDSLEKKLKSYSAFSAALLAAPVMADAQIVFNDIPDTTCITHAVGYSIDLNGDGGFEFSLAPIKGTSSASFYRQIVGFGSNSIYSVAASTQSGIVYPLVLNEGDRIGDDLSWEIYSSYLWVLAKSSSAGSGAVKGGNWLGAEDKYLGFRIELEGTKRYGWARVSIDTNANSVTIKSFAYQVLPDSAIIAGDTFNLNIGVPSVSVLNAIRIFSNGQQVFVYNSGNPAGEMKIEVMDLMGRKVKSLAAAGAQTSFSLEGSPEGIYLVKVQQGEGVKTRKVSIR
jgi:hypothetical protein